MKRETRIALVIPCMLAVMAVMAVVSTVRADDSGTIADLFYDPITGNVRVSAKEAGGSKITSFQFENAAGTFVPGNYIGPTAGTFGGFFEDVSTKVIADTDFTFVGFSGTHNFGNIFPAGMDLAQLGTYLTVAVYTGALGTGQENIDLLLVPDLPDANGDKVVDAADYVIMKRNFGAGVGGGMEVGNFDLSGTVDWYDLDILVNKMGDVLPGQAVTTPEPATLGLLAFGALAMLRRNRRS